MRYMNLAAAALALSISITPAMAAPPSAESVAIAKRFGALESIQQISLSPDGRRLAYIGPANGMQLIFIADLTTGGLPKPIMKLDPSEGRLTWCSWASDDRLICELHFIVNDAGQLLGFTRMVALDADGTRMVRLTAETNSRSLGMIQYGGGVLDWDIPERPGAVLMSRVFVPEVSTGTLFRNDGEGVGVELVDTVTLKRTKVEQPRRDAMTYISDGHGSIRIMGTQKSDDRGQLGNAML